MSAPRKGKPRTGELHPRMLTGDFPPGSSVLVGFSGGADSVALTHLLWRLAKEGDLNLTACHINHCLRGPSGDEDMEFCERFCDRLEIPFVSVELDIAELARNQKIGLEEAGRAARHFILNQLAIEDDFDLVALGHHLDDQVETILFRLFRGTGPDGLAGIRQRRGRIIRPLLRFSRNDILQYLTRNGLEHREDQSNTDETFDRNYIRRTVLPAIEDRFSAVRESVVRLAELSAAESEFLETIVSGRWRKLVRLSPGGAVIVDKSGLIREDVWLQRRLLRRAVEVAAGRLTDLSFSAIEGLVSLAARNQGARSLSNDLTVRLERNSLIFVRGRGARIKKKSLTPGKKVALPEIFSLLKTRFISRDEVNLTRQKRGYRAQVDGARIRGELSVRSFRAGDRFRPLGMRGSKTMGDFFTDLKVPAPLRGEVPLVCDEEGIVWVAGFQIAERVKLPVKLPEKSLGLAQPLELELVRHNKTTERMQTIL